MIHLAKQFRAFIIVIVMISLMIGCASNQDDTVSDYQTVAEPPHRDMKIAHLENARGLKLLRQGKLSAAEQAFKKALSADVQFGPAHNNLGKVYFKQSKLYLAAWEFEYAGKLMAAAPEPRNNLGMVYETIGRLDAAINFYNAAYQLDPENPEIIGNLVRAKMRRGDHDPRMRDLLTDLALRDTRPDWNQWAKEKLVFSITED